MEAAMLDSTFQAGFMLGLLGGAAFAVVIGPGAAIVWLFLQDAIKQRRAQG